MDRYIKPVITEIDLQKIMEQPGGLHNSEGGDQLAKPKAFTPFEDDESNPDDGVEGASPVGKLPWKD